MGHGYREILSHAQPFRNTPYPEHEIAGVGATVRRGRGRGPPLERPTFGEAGPIWVTQRIVDQQP
jgi:hypothetical protein